VKYYIASRFSRRSFLREVRTALVWMGHEVTSTWLDEDLDFNELTEKQKRAVATRDEHQIRESDVVLLDCEEPLSEGSGGGREYEAGFGKGSGLCLVRIGPAYNPFHSNADLRFRDWNHFIDYTQKEGTHDVRQKRG